MDSHSRRAACAASRVLCALAGLAAVATLTAAAHAQTQPEPAKSTASATDQERFPARQTVFLKNATDSRQLNDIQTDLRNVFPRMKIYGVYTDLAITVVGTQEDVDEAQKMIAELDRPIKTYRFTYTLTEIDNGNRGEAQKYVLVAESEETTSFVEGTKVPIVTAATDKSEASTQFQYIDVGLRIQASPSSSADGLRLHTKIERSSVAGQQSIGGVQEPILNQTTLDATANLTVGKPQVLGSMDVPGTTKKLEITVTAETVK